MKDKVRGANGGDIEVLGIADIPLELGGVCFFQTAIVCSILQDGILGQDFISSLQVVSTTGRCSLRPVSTQYHAGLAERQSQYAASLYKTQ